MITLKNIVFTCKNYALTLSTFVLSQLQQYHVIDVASEEQSKIPG